MAATRVRERVRNTSGVTRWTVAGVVAACLLVGGFVAYEEQRYAAGHAYGEREEILRTHVFDGAHPGAHPGGDVSAYADRAEQECAEHGAADGEYGDSRKWLEGCVDAVLRR